MSPPPVTPATFTLEIAELSDPGRDPRKAVNEDACGHAATPLGELLIVCDGMGGHSGGQAASQLALRTLLENIAAHTPGDPPAASLAEAVRLAGRKVYALGDSAMHFGRPGSTCVALLFHPSGGVEVAHVGDSRAYLARGGKIQALTRDHSMVQQMVDAGMLHPDLAAKHPDSNKITRALGLEPETEVELRPSPVMLEGGDIFLLGSDGIWDLVAPEEALDLCASEETMQRAAERLVELANARGGYDNVTIQLAKVLGLPGPGALATIVQMPAAAVLARLSPTVLDNASERRGSARRGDTEVALTPGHSAPSAPSGPTASISPAAAATVIQPVMSSTRPAPSRRGLMLLAGGMVIVVGIVAAVLLWWLSGAPEHAR